MLCLLWVLFYYNPSVARFKIFQDGNMILIFFLIIIFMQKFPGRLRETSGILTQPYSSATSTVLSILPPQFTFTPIRTIRPSLT